MNVFLRFAAAVQESMDRGMLIAVSQSNGFFGYAVYDKMAMSVDVMRAQKVIDLWTGFLRPEKRRWVKEAGRQQGINLRHYRLITESYLQVYGRILNNSANH
ncbi:hypothetical protein BTW01_07680 [Bacillus sp. SKDU12]|nr:hypothetical protein BTW01_07680 [Bacillus sp. SKDU12]